MELRKKFISVVGVLALTMSMTAGIASAQDATTSGEAGVSITVLCGPANSGTTTYSLGPNPEVTSTNFDDFDPSSEVTTSSTQQKALRLSMDIAPCEADGWSISASITDFTSDTAAVGIAGSSFTLPSGEPNASVNATSVNGIETGVVGPNETVTFLTEGGVDDQGRPIWNGSEPIASHDGTSDVSGAMSMDYTGVLTGLNDTIEPGTYTAEITVTFNVGQP